tara:strand:+ start:16 stop:339 length:324 start_codon:yes stop_codon:yes gene_type:complete
METTINMILNNPVYMAIAVIILILLIYALIKKIIKLILGFGILLIMYAFYLNYTGKEVPKDIDSLKESVADGVNDIKATASESIIEAKKTTKKIVEKKVEEKLDKIF